MTDHEAKWSLARVKRDWCPEWLWKCFCWKGLACYQPFKAILTREVSEFEDAKFNGNFGGKS